MKGKTSILAAASLIGTIIGAGIFGIPYVMAKSGVASCFFYFLILGVAVIVLHLLYGEVLLRTKEKHRIIGFTEKYLGKKSQVPNYGGSYLGGNRRSFGLHNFSRPFFKPYLPFLNRFTA